MRVAKVVMACFGLACLVAVAVPRGTAERVARVAALGPVLGAPGPAEALTEVQGAVERASMEAWLAGQQALLDEWLRAQPVPEPPRPVYTAPRPTGGTVGECTGFSIPDYIIQRESGGRADAYNPSGAYGCAQTLLGHYNDGGTCAGLNPYDIQGQRDCVYRLSNGGTNLAPWAYSPATANRSHMNTNTVNANPSATKFTRSTGKNAAITNKTTAIR